MTIIGRVLVFLPLLTGGALASEVDIAQQKPNVVLILADDKY